MMSFENKRLERYVLKHQFTVNGWLDFSSSYIIAKIASAQSMAGIGGAVGEIGVHHGRLFHLLACSVVAGEKAWAVDVFDRQDLNVDGSGKGDRQAFLAHYGAYVGDSEDLVVIEDSSLNVSAEDIRERAGLSRLLSIDGGHTDECTVNDLRLAEGCIENKGIVILDDVFNAAWPGAVSGLARYNGGQPKMIPFAISPNKVYLTRRECAEEMRVFLKTNVGDLFDKSSDLLGSEVDIYGIARGIREPIRLNTLGKRVKASIKALIR